MMNPPRGLVAGLVCLVLAALPACLAPSPTAPDAQTNGTRDSSFTCIQVIGFSQTRQWYSSEAFESRVDDGTWQLLWNGGASIDRWTDPNYVGWRNPPVSPCARGSSNPDRIVLTISGDFQTDPDVWARHIREAIVTIRTMYSAVRQIVLQAVVGGPDHGLCHVGGQVVRASFNHPVIDQAIQRVVGVDVVAGFSPEVRTCQDYADSTGHLTEAAAGPIGAAIGAFYAAFP